MENVSSSYSQKANVPKLRFPEFDGEWNENLLKSIFDKVFDKNTELQIVNVICNSAKNGLIPQRDYFDKDIANIENTNNYYIIKQGDFVYNPRKSIEAPFGPVSNYKYSKDGIVSPLYLCFRAKYPIITEFYEWYFKSTAWHRYIYMAGDSGVRHDRVSMRDEVFFNMPLHIPTEKEQLKIATFLTKFNDMIEKQQQLVENLKTYKRGVVKSIFNKSLKFSNDDGTNFSEWKYIPICEIGSFFGGLSGKSKEDFEHGEGKFIPYINVYKNTFTDKYNLVAVDVKSNEKQNTIRYGDIMFTQSSETIEEVGLTSVWLHNTTPYLNSFCMALRPNNLDMYMPEYMGYVMRSPNIREQIMKAGQGISRINLSSSRIEKICIPIPSPTEQSKIADFLKAIDKVIYKNEVNLESLRTIKTALLQNLFV
jgi:type I restriction enzyme S subunit